MLRRFISLYYGSIDSRKILLAILSLPKAFFIGANELRNQLHKQVKVSFPNSEVFSFGSARSSITFCLKSYGIGSGDEVLVSAYTCLAVPIGIIAAGATPVYVDIDKETLNIDSQLLKKSIGENVRAIILQHTLGKPADFTDILSIAKGKDILVIEDCALSIGSSINGKMLGSIGDAAIISMELSKAFTCGWGGILLINNEELKQCCIKSYAKVLDYTYAKSSKDLFQTLVSAFCHNSSVYSWLGKYIIYFGFKFKIFRRSTPAEEYIGVTSADFLRKIGHFQAGLALIQWKYFREEILKAANIGEKIRLFLSEYGFTTPGSPNEGEMSTSPRVSFLVNNRAEASDYFFQRGIELGEWFDGPLSPEPSTPNFNYNKSFYKNAETIANHIVNLPSHLGLTISDLDHIKTVLRDFVRDHPENIADRNNW